MPSTASKSANGKDLESTNASESRGASSGNAGQSSPGSQSAPVSYNSLINLNDNNSKNYEEINLIGTGAYGTVYRARDLKNGGNIVALKKFRVPMTADGIPMSTIREISILKNFECFEHPNIVRLFDICGHTLYEEQQLVLFLVFEHVEQDLSQYLERCPSPGLGPDRIKDILFQLLCGVDFLHSNRVVHRDLKPQNILVTNQGQVKIADFGLARIYDPQTVLTSVVVTLWYRSPEVLLQASYATPVDVWSCGCIFAELFRRKPLFCGQSEIDQLVKIFEILGTPDENQWPENVSYVWNSFPFTRGISLNRIVPEMCSLGKDLFQKMLVFDPNNRISASDALSHHYFVEDNMFPIELKKKTTNPSTPTSSSRGSSSNTSTPDSQPEK